jgi:hypothetical protein
MLDIIPSSMRLQLIPYTSALTFDEYCPWIMYNTEQ